MNNLHLVLGGPGCGKTTRLLEIVQEELTRGVPSSAIAFVTFNKDASDRGRVRAAEKFHLDLKQDLPWFRTIHSLAYGLLGTTRDEMMEPRDWQEFSAMVGEVITGSGGSAEDGAPQWGGREMGDTLLRIIDFSRTTLMPLEDCWHMLDEPVDWFRLKRFALALQVYKDDTGKIDFTDLLTRYATDGPAINVQVAIIDEAQDLTAAQWAVVRRCFAGAERVYVAGDDDQAIYQWAGADVPQFLTLSRTPEVLHISHRLPEEIHAFSQRIAQRISRRYIKEFRPSDRSGRVEWHQYVDGVDLSRGTWFLLARNNYMLRHIEQVVRAQGMNYTTRSGPAVLPTDVRAMLTWEQLRSGKRPDMSAAEFRALAKALDLPKPQAKELQRYTLANYSIGVRVQHPWYEALTGIPIDRRDFYLACLRRGEKLTHPPRIRIDTIHGVKGNEADHVLMMTDMSHRTAASFRLNADNEHRVFYVGATRALQSLHLIMPQSDLSYNLT